MEEKKENNIGLQFHTFSFAANNQPVFNEGGRNAWINYGDDNLYPRYLVDLLNKSSTHNAIVKRKTDMTASEGWEETSENEEFIKNEFGKENLNKIAYKNAYDLNLYGAFAILITWSTDRKSIARIKYVDASEIRIAKEVDEKTDLERYKRQEDGVEFYYWSSDWTQTRKEKYKPKLIQGFSKEYNDEPTQLIYHKEYRPGTHYYTLPNYVSSIDWIELDKEIANFHLNSAKNGFTPSLVINFKSGVPSQEEQNKFHRKLQEKYAGSDNASKIFITYSDNPDNAPDIVPIEANSNDTRFIQLQETISTELAKGHRISPIVMGVLIPGKLGGGTELIQAESVFQRNVINGLQYQIEEIYNELAEINGISDLKLNKTEPLKPFMVENEVQMTGFDFDDDDVSVDDIILELEEDSKGNAKIKKTI